MATWGGKGWPLGEGKGWPHGEGKGWPLGEGKGWPLGEGYLCCICPLGMNRRKPCCSEFLVLDLHVRLPTHMYATYRHVYTCILCVG